MRAWPKAACTTPSPLRRSEPLGGSRFFTRGSTERDTTAGVTPLSAWPSSSPHRPLRAWPSSPNPLRAWPRAASPSPLQRRTGPLGWSRSGAHDPTEPAVDPSATPPPRESRFSDARLCLAPLRPIKHCVLRKNRRRELNLPPSVGDVEMEGDGLVQNGLARGCVASPTPASTAALRKPEEENYAPSGARTDLCASPVPAWDNLNVACFTTSATETVPCVARVSPTALRPPAAQAGSPSTVIPAMPAVDVDLGLDAFSLPASSSSHKRKRQGATN